MEKVHGANFSFVTNGIDVKVAKRSSFVEPGDQFFNTDEVYNKYKDCALKAFELHKKEAPDLETLHIYGEFFGGTYPHPDVKNIPVSIRCR